ncbi:putative F-box/LRR-repeat protein [Cardamine amara subsp. amara]|uniref:F-box/LRR-repeat protein n=1 Tax=Cardamine amara subsp. amara TaxID=228776 RepID=A0ABD1BU45_CARAN
MDDKISQLPDDLLLKVLLFLPTKVAASTSILSKRWEFLWMWLSKLEYNSIEEKNYDCEERRNLQNFIDLNLPLHRAPVIESFCLKFSKGSYRSFKPTVIKMWVLIAVSRCLRELSLDLFACTSWPTCLPSSLYTCKSLVILKLIDKIFVDVPRMACLPSLKTLFLRRVTYSNENSLHQLLSSCPVLEDLVLERGDGLRNPGIDKWRVIVPSLQRLTIKISRCSNFDEVVINTPSLKYFKVTDYKEEYVSENDDDRYSFKFKDMPQLEEADIDSTYPDIDKFVKSIKFVKRLSLCIIVNAEEDLYPEGIVFNHLEHLKLCPCHSNWSKLLVRLLKDSPNLRELEVSLNDDH